MKAMKNKHSVMACTATNTDRALNTPTNQAPARRQHGGG
jgi:hypothetical protein